MKHLIFLLISSNILAQIPPLTPAVDPIGNSSTPDKILLGKVLYWDEQLSSTKTVACASCHIFSSGGTDPRAISNNPFSINAGFDGIMGTNDDVTGSMGVPESGVNGNYIYNSIHGYNPQVTGRRSPASINAGYAHELFFDGRASSQFLDPITSNVILTNGAALESQAAGPPISSIEMGHNNRQWSSVINAVETAHPLALSPFVSNSLLNWINTQNYFQLFEKTFGTPEITAAKIAMAIAAYERSLYSNQAPFDLMIATNDNSYLTIQERAGFQLFQSQGCNTCHSGALFSDELFHNIGVRPNIEDSGRFAVTGLESDRGRFKTTSLRNLQYRTSFMHNGRLSTLEQVVEFYNRGGDFNNPNLDTRIQPLFLSPTQKSSLVAFLGHALTDPRVTNETGPFAHPQLYALSSRAPHVSGDGVVGTDGKIPQLTAIEPPLLGNENFTVAVENALVGNLSTFVVALNDPGIDDLPSQSTSLFYETGILQGSNNGHLSLSIELPSDPNMIGTTLYARWYITDSQAINGYAISPLLEFTLFAPTVVVFSDSFDT